MALGFERLVRGKAMRSSPSSLGLEQIGIVQGCCRPWVRPISVATASRGPTGDLAQSRCSKILQET
jgi:hypothetical protein